MKAPSEELYIKSTICDFLLKLTITYESTREWVTDYRMFMILNNLKSTATGLNGLAAWFYG